MTTLLTSSSRLSRRPAPPRRSILAAHRISLLQALWLLFVTWLTPAVVSAQSDWELRTDRKDIKVYTRTYPDSKYKAIKVELNLESTLSRLVTVLLDVKTAPEWVYSTKSAVLLKQVSPNDLIYYSEVKLPWPMSNRDFIARLITTQDPATRVVTINGPTITDYVPVKKDIVRVRKSEGKWIITPTGEGHLRIEYTLQTDPGGDIPAWLFNLFVTKGPLESFEKLREQIKKPAYDNATLPFIVD
jgi:hypothetical protein